MDVRLPNGDDTRSNTAKENELLLVAYIPTADPTGTNVNRANKAHLPPRKVTPTNVVLAASSDTQVTNF